MLNHAATLAQKPERDVRLDFFRGLAMFIIFVAHVPENMWVSFIPARFGFSSAAELFVFCSGLASAYAFGRAFVGEGWLSGTKRILYRIWQVYWAHIGLALVLMTISVIGLEVPHAHMHLLPIHSSNDLNFTRPKLKCSGEELKAAQQKILAKLG